MRSNVKAAGDGVKTGCREEPSPTSRSRAETETCSLARRLTSICLHANSCVAYHKLAGARVLYEKLTSYSGMHSRSSTCGTKGENKVHRRADALSPCHCGMASSIYDQLL